MCLGHVNGIAFVFVYIYIVWSMQHVSGYAQTTTDLYNRTRLDH